jgi:hypothetical protein
LAENVRFWTGMPIGAYVSTAGSSCSAIYTVTVQYTEN